MLTVFSPASAVLNERNLGQTLAVLREELEMYHNDSKRNQVMARSMKEQMQKRIVSIMNESNQISLMLYSQKIDYIFDLTYACNKATDLYDNFNTMRLPFDKISTRMQVEVARYNGLIDNLRRMPSEILTEKENIDRDVCLTLCIAIKRSLQSSSSEINEYQHIYDMVGRRLKVLNDYAIKRYENIRQSIFINADESYFSVLMNLPNYVMRARYSLHEKYSAPKGSHVVSQWRGPIVIAWFLFIIFYVLLSVALNLLVIKFVLPKRFKTPAFKAKETCIIFASTTITFAIVLMVLWLFVLKHNFFIVASKLLVQFAWLLAVLFVSLLIRLDAGQIKKGFRIYLPLMVMGFVVISFRIIFIPNELVTLIFPPLMLIAALWQLSTIMRYQKSLPRSDMFYSSFTFVMILVSLIASWMGYTLLSVQLLIWWIMQFTCIQTVTCIYDLVLKYGGSHFQKDGSDIRQTLGYDFVRHVLVPVLLIVSVVLSFYMATDVFSLSELCRYLFFTNFIDIKGVAKINLLKILIVLSTFFIVKYIVYVFRSFFVLYYGGTKKSVTGEKALVLKASTFSIWFIYIVVSMMGLHISTSGILVAMGGLSTGIGFAMKDTLENLFYGVSLMTGRLHIGDIIECDGVRGQVVDISYQSTMVESLDGSIIAFLNNQLFSKNFKNLTRNHHYEVALIPVDVAYGTDIKKAREVISEALSQNVSGYDASRGFRVVVKELGESAVELQIVIWVPVATKIYIVGNIYEAVYNAFNAAGISMPFPQRDVHVIAAQTLSPEEQGALNAAADAAEVTDKDNKG